jgi:hypothetical protein
MAAYRSAQMAVSSFQREDLLPVRLDQKASCRDHCAELLVINNLACGKFLAKGAK